VNSNHLCKKQCGDLKKAIDQFEAISSLRPGDGEVPKLLARWYFRSNKLDKAINVVASHIRTYPLASDPTHVNILAELYMEKKLHRAALNLITEETAALPGLAGALPVDLQVRHNVYILSFFYLVCKQTFGLWPRASAQTPFFFTRFSLVPSIITLL
jgi:tetratricopeptide (TPR) repeat protein